MICKGWGQVYIWRIWIRAKSSPRGLKSAILGQGFHLWWSGIRYPQIKIWSFWRPQIRYFPALHLYGADHLGTATCVQLPNRLADQIEFFKFWAKNNSSIGYLHNIKRIILARGMNIPAIFEGYRHQFVIYPPIWECHFLVNFLAIDYSSIQSLPIPKRSISTGGNKIRVLCTCARTLHTSSGG